MQAFVGLVVGGITLLLCRKSGIDETAVMRGPAGISLPGIDFAWVLSIAAGLFGPALLGKFPFLAPLIEMFKNRTLPDVSSPAAVMALLQKLLGQFATNERIRGALVTIYDEIIKLMVEDAKAKAGAIVNPEPVKNSPFEPTPAAK